MSGEAATAEHNAVLASAITSRFYAKERKLALLLARSKSKPAAFSLEGKQKERIYGFRHGWREQNIASFV